MGPGLAVTTVAVSGSHAVVAVRQVRRAHVEPAAARHVPGGAVPSEVAFKYNFLSPAKDDFGLSGSSAFEVAWIDPHSGQKKTEYEMENMLQAQKYFMEGQLTWVGNLGFRAAYEKRKAIDNLPDGFDWPTTPEMEISFKLGTGLSYRFAPGWYAGAELMRESEFETEVGLERWTVFAGPSLHYGGEKWWSTLTYFRQLRGGGEQYAGQTEAASWPRPARPRRRACGPSWQAAPGVPMP